MNTATRAGRIAVAHRLSNAMRRTAIDDTNETPPAPPGDCGRDKSEPCGMKDENECRTHCGPLDGDPETLGFAGTLSQRREQLRAARAR
jgi:hypothetical protein